jgi:hypothetical protein
MMGKTGAELREAARKALEEASGPAAYPAEGGGGTVESKDVPKKRATKKAPKADSK